MREPLSKNLYKMNLRSLAKHTPHPAYRRSRRMHPAFFKTQAYITWKVGDSTDQTWHGRALKTTMAGETYAEGDLFTLGLFPSPRRNGYIVFHGVPRYLLKVNHSE